MFPKICAIIVFVGVMATPLHATDASATAQARIAELERQLAATQSCALAPDDLPVQLLRKLARQADNNARVQLGLASGPLMIPDDLLSAHVPGEYIVTLTPEALPLSGPADVTARFGIPAAQVLHSYGAALSGFAVRMDLTTRDRLLVDPQVAGVAQNGYVFASSITPPLPAPSPVVNPMVHPAQATPGLINVYVFDTGIRSSHIDLRGRVNASGFSFFENGIDTEDCAGHGTHVAARIAGQQLGLTDKARLTSVKVIDRFGTGDEATVIAGIDWVLAQPGAVKLVNMSLTRRPVADTGPLDMAVQALIDAGALVVVAAGNAAADAGDFSPARVPGAITVGSVTDSRLSDFSNAGTTVDLYAPGEDIPSASIRDVCAVRAQSGTSMAAPHVTGLLAEILAQGVSPELALSTLISQAERIATGAYEGEVERLILKSVDTPVTLCPDRPKTGISGELEP